MRLPSAIIAALLISTAVQCVCAQPSRAPPTLVEVLTLQYFPPNEIALLSFPPSTFSFQTAIAVRYTLFTSVPQHEITAACDPVILSFFGTKDHISRDLCSEEARVVIESYIKYRLIASEFPQEARGIGEFYAAAGLTPYSSSRDKNTRIGWANVIADRLIDYFSSDGWNSLGDANRDHYRQSFSDSVGYVPQNPAFLPPDKLYRPLRWQPLTGPLDSGGTYGSQVHVVPQLGVDVVPLTISPDDLFEKQAESPYEFKDQVGGLSAADDAKVRKSIGKLFDLSANLTTEQVVLSHWWDNKFFSLGIFALYYINELGIGSIDGHRIVFGDLLAKYDASVVAWKEKLRHDLVRPPTIIRRLLKWDKVRAFKGFGKGVGLVRAEEWEPVVRIQPHSEFPSASAVICQASGNAQTALFRQILGNVTLPRFERVIPPFNPPGSPVDVPVELKFETLQDAVRSCGHSRLLAGVHFEPSVDAGFKLAEGIGEKAAEHLSALFAGRIPENCARCLTNRDAVQA